MRRIVIAVIGLMLLGSVAVLGAPAPVPPGRGLPVPTVPGVQPLPTTRAVALPPATATAPACSGPGDGATDQHGVSVDVWAPGVRLACGMAYENGDNPLPAGTLLPPPRPFRFAGMADHAEPVNGFKVFYVPGTAGNGCGDLREIMHMGMGAGRYTTRFHSLQLAVAFCPTGAPAGGVRVLDVAGFADTGCLLAKAEHTQGIACPNNPNERLEAAAADCASGANGNTWDDANHEYTRGDLCWPTWYGTLNIVTPAGLPAGFEGSLIVRDTQTWMDAARTGNVLTDQKGIARSMNVALAFGFAGDGQWCARFDMASGTNVLAACGAAGTWRMRVDAGIGGDPVFDLHATRGTIHHPPVPVDPAALSSPN